MAGPKKVVLDASVILKWFVKEDETERALKLKALHLSSVVEIVIPSLLYYEIINVLRYKQDFGKKNVENAVTALSRLQLLTQEWTKDFGIASVERAFEYGITIYDGSYLALGRAMNCPFITADKKMLAKITDKDDEHLLASFDVDEWIS
jgi:predicted nucleic acid-binding protein